MGVQFTVYTGERVFDVKLRGDQLTLNRIKKNAHTHTQQEQQQRHIYFDM